MKKMTSVLLLGVLLAGSAQAQETPRRQPVGSVSLVLIGSLAFVGVSGELLLGSLGIGAQVSAFGLGGSGNFILFYEPGFYGRFYMGNPVSAFYLTAGLTYFNIVGKIEGESFNWKSNIVNINTGIGYNAFFGDNRDVRFSIEIGPRYVTWLEDTSAGFFWPHFAMMFGAGF